MQMEQAGTPVVEREFIFTTPEDRGLSYKLLDPTHSKFANKVAECFKYFEKSVKRSKCEDLCTAEDIVQRVSLNVSHLWVSCEDDKIVGCFVIGFGHFPQSKGIGAEAISGKFDFSVITPVVEKFYKALGYEFFEMTGRKGWERVMQPMGYEFKSITIRKRL